MHFDSFMRSEDNLSPTYKEMAEILIPYLKTMGYTHVEFMPLQEYPYDPSWGYQICAFYSVTSRFGHPNDFKYLIDSLHQSGIGVILDWVPAHFPKDEWGLCEFDGGCLYEYQGRDRIESNSWGTRFFDLGREEVQSFLISNAAYFINEFHIDGLRVDAVAAMLYLDFDRQPGEWIPNEDGQNINLEAVAFIKKLNSFISEYHPDIITIAEESTAFSKITTDIPNGGLGFSLKWNMGWANDFFEYLTYDPIYRKFKHSALTFPVCYAFSERYCLPISHDEVVYGKRSFINKLFGSINDKFNGARCAILLMMTYPGKKLLFMGCEIAQFSEWNYSTGLEWDILKFPIHSDFHNYIASLNHFYLSTPELWELDFSEAGFSWILPNESEKNLVVYKRHDKLGNSIYIAINFSGTDVEFILPTEESTRFQVVFDTGNLVYSNPLYETINLQECTKVKFNLPALSGIIFKELNGNNIFKV